jgi:NADH dehydrogenase [ubiquinone] 1 alpha subcomplex assembly factor 7
MTPLQRQLVHMIRQDGPISVEQYMAMCLGHYYGTRDPFGAAGDFTTAPEISQMFGELIGLWAADLWQRMGAPASVRLVELGPGRGTLMADMLRVSRALPGFTKALEVHLVETSPVLRARQGEALASFGKQPVWHDSIDAALEGPVILIANEFLDALPVRQFQRANGGWHERLVGLDGEGNLAFGLQVAKAAEFGGAPDGTIIEKAEIAAGMVSAIAAHVAREGGAALFIDYGSMIGGTGDTLQAVKRHKSVGVFDEPGEADLTVQVDFAAMARVAAQQGAVVAGPVTQGAFLAELGLQQRADALKSPASAAQAAAVDAAVARLTAPATTGMGELFKVMAVAHPALTVMAGFQGLPRLASSTKD